MPRLVALCLVALPLISLAQAQDSPIPQATLQELAKDLATLQTAVMEAQTQLEAEQQAKAHGLGMKDWSSTPYLFVTGANAKIKAGADMKAATIADASKGEKLRVVDRASDWYAVELPNPTKGMKVGWLNAESVVPDYSPMTASVTSPRVTYSTAPSISQSDAIDRILQTLTSMASTIKAKYTNNPYVSVTGFTFNAAVPPSVSLNFEFKNK